MEYLQRQPNDNSLAARADKLRKLENPSKEIDPGSTVWSDVCQDNGICMRQSGIFGSGGCCTGIASRLHKCWEAEEATVDDVDPKPPGSSKPLASSFSLSLARTNLSPSASGVCARHGMC
jgi:hypothetical protein